MELNAVDRRCVQVVRPSKGGGGSGNRPRRLKIFVVLYDTLSCHSWDGTDEGTEIIVVAKPWLLRKTPFNGASRNGFTYSEYAVDGTMRLSTRDSDGETEQQIITPDWVAGDEIHAVPADTGVTGADLLDLNVDGRCWARVAPPEV